MFDRMMFKDKRREMNLTAAELAGLLGVSPQAVCMWENGQRQPSYRRTARIAEVLHLNAEELQSNSKAEFVSRVQTLIEGVQNDLTEISELLKSL